MTASSSHSKSGAIPSVEDDPRWLRILARDRTADGQFWYSVVTTGIYCRPSCPSRAANPKNVRLHDTSAEARKAGFRPCKRCNPDGPSPHGAGHAAIIAAACRLMERSEVVPTLAQLARAARLSPGYFHRLFKAATGLTPKEYSVALRADRMRKALNRDRKISDAIYTAGFNSNSRFYEKSSELLGMTPTRYRSGGLDEDIRFAVGQCSLGAILVASSTKGVVAILLGDDPDLLVRDLQDQFPQAHLIGGEKDYESRVARVIGFVEAPRLGLDLPLDVRGTAFQQRVWRALREIPAGKTATYADIACRIAAPKSVRAVAGACAANRIAVAIPCHRVIRRDGSLSGYRWGVERKRILLDRESGETQA